MLFILNMLLKERLNNLINQGFFHVFIGTFLTKAIAMISSVIVARLVAKDDYAFLSYSETLYSYLTLFLGLGLSSALLKTCSSNKYVSSDWGYLKFTLKIGLLYELLLIFVFVTISMSIDLPFKESKPYIMATSFYPLLYYIYDVFFTYLRAKQLNKIYAWLSLLYSILTCLFTITLVYWYSCYGVVIARYIAIVALVLIIFLYLNRFLKGVEKKDISREQKKDFLFMAISLMLANALSGMMPINENLLVSNIIIDPETTANFRVASLFPQLIILVTQSIMIYYFPIVSSIDNAGSNTRKVVFSVALLNIVLVMVALIVGILLTPWLIKTFYSEKYVNAIPLAYLLWMVHGINAGLRIVPINMLIAIRRYKFNLYMSVFSVIVQLLLDWYFITIYGVMGVVIGTIFVYTITGLAYWYLYIHYSKTNNI